MSSVEQRKDRQRLQAYIEREQLVSVLNDTKWERLFRSFQILDDILDFRRKDVRDPSSEAPLHWDADLYHVMGAWHSIEWLEVRAKVSRSRGALLQVTVEDHTARLLEAVKSAGVPFEMTEEGIRIWGYLRPGVSPKWVDTT